MTISSFINTINADPTTKFKISTNPAIDINELRKIEQQFSITLPQDLVEFYTTCNGIEGDDWIFHIIPFKEVERNIDDAGIYIMFAEYMIYSEICGLEIDPIDSNKYRFFNTTSAIVKDGVVSRKYIADSIIDFITLYCKYGTFGIWYDDRDP